MLPTILLATIHLAIMHSTRYHPYYSLPSILLGLRQVQLPNIAIGDDEDVQLLGERAEIVIHMAT